MWHVKYNIYQYYIILHNITFVSSCPQNPTVWLSEWLGYESTQNLLIHSARVCYGLLSVAVFVFHAHLKWAWALVRGLLLWMLSLHCVSLRYKVLQSVTTCCPTRCNVLRFTLCSSNFFAFTRVLLRERRTICARWLLCSTTWVSCLVLQMPLQMRSSWCDEKCHFCILLWVCLYCIVLLHDATCEKMSCFLQCSCSDCLKVVFRTNQELQQIQLRAQLRAQLFSVVALVSRSSSNPFSVHLSDTSCYRLEICSLWPENIFIIVNRSS